MPAPNRAERAAGALLGLALGDAIGWPALFHKQFGLKERRRQFLWRTNARASLQRIIRVAVPFTHRDPEEIVAAGPTDDTELALLTATILLESGGRQVTREAFAQGWRRLVLPRAGEVFTGFAERAALENLARGLEPPASGGDNPQHYDDAACARAVSVGLAFAGDPDGAARVAAWDAEVTHAEDGIWAAQAMAAAVAVLSGNDGSGLADALAVGRAQLPPGSWIASMDERARQCAAEASDPLDLALLLGREVVGGIYSYGNAAPETLPCAFVLAEACHGEPARGATLANTIARSADALPALVGALCGAHAGAAAIPPAWRVALDQARGVCLPMVAGVRLSEIAARLAALEESRGHA